MSSDHINRRKFIATAAASAATFTIVPRHVLGKGFVPPSDKINIANIGCGTQGLREMGEMLTNEEIQITTVCDVNKYSTDYLDWSPSGLIDGMRNTLGNASWGGKIQGIPGGRDLGKKYVDDYNKKVRNTDSFSGCNAYEDFRELLEKENDIDAVKIMTPDHSHAVIALEAMKKGKHVITHKPIANRLAEGRKVIGGIKKYGVLSHLLAWSDKPNYRLIKKWIDDGVIGNLKEIHNWSFRPVWPQFMGKPKENRPIPEGFNWNLWLGPVPDMAYHPNYTHNVFRGWYDFGGGSIADMGHYSLFPLFRILGISTAPKSAKAYGTVYRTTVDNVCRPVENESAFPYSCMYKFQFPDQENLGAFDLFWYDGGMKPFAPEELEIDGRDIAPEGLMFVGDKGKILAGFQGHNPELIPKQKMDAYTKEKMVAEETSENRTETWIKTIKTGKESSGSFLHAGPITDMMNLGAIALRAGKKVDFDSENMRITNDEAANQFLTREYRKGWEI
jgi:predicted dehydrogenase